MEVVTSAKCNAPTCDAEFSQDVGCAESLLFTVQRVIPVCGQRVASRSPPFSFFFFLKLSFRLQGHKVKRMLKVIQEGKKSLQFNWKGWKTVVYKHMRWCSPRIYSVFIWVTVCFYVILIQSSNTDLWPLIAWHFCPHTCLKPASSLLFLGNVSLGPENSRSLWNTVEEPRTIPESLESPSSHNAEGKLEPVSHAHSLLMHALTSN